MLMKEYIHIAFDIPSSTTKPLRWCSGEDSPQNNKVFGPGLSKINHLPITGPATYEFRESQDSFLRIWCEFESDANQLLPVLFFTTTVTR